MQDAKLIEIGNHPGWDESTENSKIYAEFQCPICLGTCLSPVVPQCGHHHCKQCLLNCPEKVCSLCQKGWKEEELDDLSAPRDLRLRNVYTNVEVFCKVCFAKVPRGIRGELFEHHIPNCPIACPHCEFDTTRGQLAAHLTVCPDVPVSTPGCQKLVPRADLDKHTTECTICQFSPILIQFQLENKQLRESFQHLRNEMIDQVEAYQRDNDVMRRKFDETNHRLQIDFDILHAEFRKLKQTYEKLNSENKHLKKDMIDRFEACQLNSESLFKKLEKDMDVIGNETNQLKMGMRYESINPSPTILMLKDPIRNGNHPAQNWKLPGNLLDKRIVALDVMVIQENNNWDGTKPGHCYAEFTFYQKGKPDKKTNRFFINYQYRSRIPICQTVAWEPDGEPTLVIELHQVQIDGTYPPQGNLNWFQVCLAGIWVNAI